MKIIDDLEDVEIRFTRNPKKPKLLCTRTIYANWFDINLYTPRAQEEAQEEEAQKSRPMLVTKPQLKEFIDAAYLSTDPKSKSYDYKYVSMNDIMLEVQEFSLVFKNEPFSKFKAWCTSQHLNYLNAGVKRTSEKIETRLSCRGIYVLKDYFKDALLQQLSTVPEQYKDYINGLKQDRFDIVGYCRKSKTRGDSEGPLSDPPEFSGRNSLYCVHE